ncbi:MAG: AMP-binding protein [Deltaproteobacteria bacterium]|nr:AMP-binding protein [Deltaproteobacteria bacterium]MBW2077202.1 AMP-binding protein [Deltaproteobacteria bacterium]
MLRGRTYEEVTNNFKWEIPEHYNVGVDVCDKWADEKYRLALIYIDREGRDHKYTFWELKNLSNQLANALRARGIEKEDRVGILLPPCPEALLSHIAIYKLAAIAVPLLPLFGPQAVEFRLENSESKAVITDTENLPKVLDSKDRLPNLELIMVVNSGGREDTVDFWEDLEKGSRAFDPAPTKPEDPALIIYTSGTTGPPKGTLHGHQILLGILPGFEFYHNLFPRQGDLVWTPLDWAYIGGSYDTLFPTLHHGYPLLAYRPRRFDPEEAFYYVAKYGVTNIMAVPTVLRMMMNAVKYPREQYDLRLRSITVGGETLGEELAAWCKNSLGVELNEQYGQTECDLVIGFCSEVMNIVPGAIGKAVPGHIVEIINEKGEVMGPGELGEIAVKCPDPVMFLEYWKNPEATKEKFIGDWMRTGDFGTKDNDGYFRFTGREDDIIESGGFRIGPGEIEDCLMKHESVALVGVIGAPDKLRGEIVKAFIVPQDGVKVDEAFEKSIKEHVKTNLEAHAYPREIEFLKEMPRTKSGKILRSELRKLHLEKEAKGDQ